METGHPARKRFGQHFLRDRQIILRIIDAIGPAPSQRLVEIGPGWGALTAPLLQAAGELDAVELDRDLIPALRRRCDGLGNLRIHQGDALKFDFTRLGQDQRRLRLAGNLPYNISTPLLFHLLAQAAWIEDMHFMLQQEVAARMAAEPRQAAYGRLSVMVQYYCQVELLFVIGPAAFSPPPKVQSALVRLVPYRPLPVPAANPERFATLVRQAFAQRRKTLRNALRELASAGELAAAGIDPGARPETLGVAEFVALSNRLEGLE